MSKLQELIEKYKNRARYYYKSGNLKCHVKFDKYGDTKGVKDFDESGNTIIIKENRYF